jgi:hypothetical protein
MVQTSCERLSVARHRRRCPELARSGCGTTIASAERELYPLTALSDRPARVVSHVARPSLVWAPPGTREALVGRRGSPVASVALGRVIGQWAIAPGTEVEAHPAALPLDLARYALRALSWGSGS